MKPIKQTIDTERHGNCLQACVASILERDLDLVPNFMLFEDFHWEATIMFFDSIGYEICFYRDPPPKDGKYYITSLTFPSRHKKGIGHVVISKDLDVVHDPYTEIDYDYDDCVMNGYYSINTK
jgi:hypothetical protein